MGRDTSITIVDKKEYEKVQTLKDILEENISNNFRIELENYIELKEYEYVKNIITYWNKWNCNDEIVELMREYNYEDGDIIMSENMLNDIDHLLTEQQLKEIFYCLRQEDLLVIYNTNG